MMDLMETLEYVRAYIDDLLCITRGSLEDHLDKIEEVLKRLCDAGLKVNAAKSFFCTHEIEYLGYMLTRGGIKPKIKKVQAILAINPPNNVKELRHFLGMVQYYRDMWAKRSEMLAPSKRPSPKRWFWPIQTSQSRSTYTQMHPPSSWVQL